MERPTGTAGHRRSTDTSGTKRKIDDKKTFEIDPEMDSSVEEQPKSKRTRVRTVPGDSQAARHSGKTYNLKRK